MAGNEQAYQEAMNQGHSEAWDLQWDKAAEQYKKAVQEKPASSLAIASLGLAYYEQKNYQDAKKCYLRAAQMQPEDPLPIEKLADIFEKTGEKQKSSDVSMKVANLHLKLKDTDKAIENWARVTRLFPEHLDAHSKLAVVHAKVGNNEQAIHEYIAVAALLQDVGQISEAVDAVNKAVQIDPESIEAKQAFELVNANKTLPKPRRPQGGTGALDMVISSEEEEIQAQMNFSDEGPDPISEARQVALTELAGLLFSSGSEEDGENETSPGGMTGMLSSGQNGINVDKITVHIGLAIDYQSKAKDQAAVKELKKAIKAGLNFPAAFYNIGMLYYRLERFGSAQRNLQRAVGHPDYALACRLMVGDMERNNGNLPKAVEEFLEALKIADVSVAVPELAPILEAQYEPLIEAHTQETDEDQLNLICDNIVEMLLRSGWREHVIDARSQLPSSVTGSLAMPVAEILTQAQSSEMVSAISKINNIARQGFPRSAMEEAFALMTTAPTYLPLHIHMGELLMSQDRTAEAVSKFTVVAEAYAARGEAGKATDLLRRIVQVSPMDLSAHKKLISRLIDQGQIEPALEEYINMANVHYRLAQLDQARATYEDALRLAQQTNVDEAWSIRILHQMADIDTQRLDYRQALVIYEQLRILVPDDDDARISIITINVRLGQANQASTELDSYLSELSASGKDSDTIIFLEKLVEESSSLIFAHRRLAEQYQQLGKVDEAIKQWNKVGEMMAKGGDREGAKQALRAILVLNPPNAEKYRAMLQNL